MDFNVTDFNVRLRTIKLRELAVAVVIVLFITAGLNSIFPIMDTYQDLLSVSFVILLFLFFVFALRGTDGFDKDIKDIFYWRNSLEIIYVLIINLSFAFLLVAIISSFDIMLSALDANWIPIIDLTPEAQNPFVYILELISAIICAPIIEELSFRGVLFNRLKIRLGILPAMLISSLIFALGHEFGGMYSAFFFGMCMCVLYLKTDNIFISMSVHFLNNLLACLIEIFNLENVILGIPGAFITLLLSTIAMILVFIYLIRQIGALTSDG